MAKLREVELRIAVAEGVISRTEAERIGEEARRTQQSPLAMLVQQGKLSDESYQSLFAAALNDPAWRAEGDEASASTYTMTAPPPAADEPPFPIASWDRYTPVRFLGQGGMGKVYLAVDTRLRREVAIKFVRTEDADHVRRLIAEARTQARVNHDRVCKVYAVDEIESKVYIAMQYIHGKPLGRCSAELTVEQKVMVVRRAAEGIHEAHRLGIIHRDIKPSNIMVERDDDGEIRPYVMDFGLARSAQEAGVTQTGALLGTPRYMAPEQAYGDPGNLDRRADIYSLGSTLYHLLTGEPPVPGETAAEVIKNLGSTEPRPLRSLDRSLPVDLEAIVLKCLERERSARYDSARALADDLGRFLDGEPVVARRAGAWYRLRKRMIKHRRLVAVGAAALVALGVAIGWAIQANSASRERERRAREFTEKVERIEALARYSALSPLHDLRADRALLTARMTRLRADIDSAGDIAAGPGHYALGRGYLALDDDDRAQTELQAAWNAQFTEPRVAYALALVTGHLYQKALLAAERISDKEQRPAKRHEVEKRYRGQVLRYLAASEGAEVASTDFVAALIAFYDGQFDTALARLGAITSTEPGNYEVPELRGDVLLARGKQRRDRGERDLAMRDFEDGRKAYAAAAALGQSVPSIYKSLGDLEYAVLAAEFYQNDITAQAERALAATRNALAAMPDHYDALLLRALIRRTLAENGGNSGNGSDVESLLKRAFADAQQAMNAAPERSQALLEMAQIQREWGRFLGRRHDDPSEHFAQAIAISNRILESERDALYWGNRGLIYSLWADAQDEVGADSQDHRDQSTAAYRRALQLDKQLSVLTNVAINWFKRGSHPRAKDPEGDLQQAEAALDAAKQINPKHSVPYFYGAKIHEARAARARAQGRDPEPELDRALAAYRIGHELSPELPHFDNGIGAILVEKASIAWQHGGDPWPLLDGAEAAYNDAIAVAPESEYGHANAGEVYIQRAWLHRACGDDPRDSVEAAIERLQAAIRLVPKSTTYLTDLAAAYAIRAGYDLEHGRDPSQDLDNATRVLEDARALNAQDTQCELYRAEIDGLRARLAARQGRGDRDAFQAIADRFTRAVASAPDNQDNRLVAGQFCLAWAAFLRDTGGTAAPALQRGKDFAADLLEHRKRWPDALILRARFALQEAESAAGATQREKATEAASDFDAALTTNRALEKLWSPQLHRARQLAEQK